MRRSSDHGFLPRYWAPKQSSLCRSDPSQNRNSVTFFFKGYICKLKFSCGCAGGAAASSTGVLWNRRNGWEGQRTRGRTEQRSSSASSQHPHPPPPGRRDFRGGRRELGEERSCPHCSELLRKYWRLKNKSMFQVVTSSSHMTMRNQKKKVFIFEQTFG